MSDFERKASAQSPEKKPTVPPPERKQSPLPPRGEPAKASRERHQADIQNPQNPRR